jgi:anti-sigma factor RsiW
MGCSPDLVKDLLLGELERAERGRVEQHIAVCPACREELDRLTITQSALYAIREEEVPRRIAFVSDKVFEPKWWQVLWSSGPKLGFVSAAMLAGAILVHGLVGYAHQPATPVAVVQMKQAADEAAIQARIDQAVNERIQGAVTKAVAEVSERKDEQAVRLVQASEKRMEFNRQADRVAMEEYIGRMRKDLSRLVVASNEIGGGPQ